MSLSEYLNAQSRKIDKALLSHLPKKTEHPASLSAAMHYAVMSGGKRVRPVLALAACEAVGGSERDVLDAACAIELVHSYSLVHDDLPCMDDDDTRRGKPSCHVRYGEVIALLAGDALLTLAFRVLGTIPPKATSIYKAKRLQALAWVAEAAGSQGMVGGQALDMEYQEKEPDLPTIEFINTHKSGALIAVSARAGAYLGGGSPKEVEALFRWGKCVGLVFQIVDDIMDRQGYARVVGEHEAREEAQLLLAKAKRELAPLSGRARRLGELTDLILTRKN